MFDMKSKKRVMRKIFASLLAVTMIVAMTPAMAFAENLECTHPADSVVTVNATEPTCSEVGYTEGIYCNLCEQYISGHEEIETSPHSYAPEVVAPTYTSGGYTINKCTVCGHEEKTDATPVKKMTRPVITVSSVNSTSAKVSWSKVAGAAEYQVYRAYSKTGKFTRVATVKGTSATVGSLTLGKTYYFKVRACNSAQKTDYSTIKSVLIRVATPVMNKTAYATSSSVKISWKKVSEASGYNVYSRSVGGSWKKIATVKGNSTLSYSNRDISGVYEYSVVAYKVYNGKTYYSLRSGTIRSRVLKPTYSVKCSQYGDGFDARVSWSKVTGATKYQYSFKKGSGSWNTPVTVTGTSVIKTQTHGVWYDYKVRAVYTYNGVTTYGPYKELKDSFILGYTPQYTVGMSGESERNAQVFGLYISNTGSAKMRVYSKNAFLMDDVYEKYDRNLKILDEDALDEDRIAYKSYIDIPAGQSRYVYFISGTPTRYNSKSIIFYEFNYDNIRYQGASSAGYGHEFMKM